MPHLLLYGPPGTGKTSIIHALSRQLYGPKFYLNRILELNASDDRGIQVVRDKIKTFASYKPQRNYNKNYPCPKYKIIILDEADAMTNEAQTALRRIIEDNTNQTRFCLICNYITKIIQPLSSRCVKLCFKPIPESEQIKKMKKICDKENVKYSQKALKKLV